MGVFFPVGNVRHPFPILFFLRFFKCFIVSSVSIVSSLPFNILLIFLGNHLLGF